MMMFMVLHIICWSETGGSPTRCEYKDEGGIATTIGETFFHVEGWYFDEFLGLFLHDELHNAWYDNIRAGTS